MSGDSGPVLLREAFIAVMATEMPHGPFASLHCDWFVQCGVAVVVGAYLSFPCQAPSRIFATVSATPKTSRSNERISLTIC